MDENLLWLHLKTTVSARKARQLIAHFGSAEAVYAADKRAYTESGIVTEAMLRDLLKKNKKEAAREAALAEAHHVTLVSCYDADYPSVLREVHDAPLVLYAQGDIAVLRDEATICIVGSRKCTTYGMSATLGIAQQLAQCGMTIVSGFAVGIDSAAHRGALRGGGKTIGVLGCGLDIPYPSENDALRREILANGVLISEFPMGTPPLSGNFPMRNRILSALSLGVIVAEAGAHSGALITAKYAAEQGKDVFAVPGNVSNALSVGTNRLIQDGATLLCSADEVLAEYIPRYPHLFDIKEAANAEVRPTAVAETGTSLRTEGLSEKERRLLKLLANGEMHVDALIREASLPAAEVNGLLTVLLLKGRIRELPGKHYIKK